MSVGQMYALGSVGSQLKQRNSEVLDGLLDLNSENLSPNIQWKVREKQKLQLSCFLQ